MNLEESKTQNFFSYLIFFIIITNLFFGYGMQITTIYLFPLNQILLLILLLSINYFSLLKKISFTNILTPYSIWFIYGFIFISFNLINRGIWALRDGSYIIDSLFILVGFAFFANERNIDVFFKILKFSFFTGLIYIFFWLFKDLVQGFSPIVKRVAGEGGEVSLFFNFSSLWLGWLWLALLAIIFNNKFDQSLFYKIVPILMLGMSLIGGQRRMVYVGLISVVIFLFYNKKISGKNIVVFALLLFLFFPIMSFLEIEIAGRFGDPGSFFFFVEHLMTVFPGFTSDDPRLVSSSGTRGGGFCLEVTPLMLLQSSSKKGLP